MNKRLRVGYAVLAGAVAMGLGGTTPSVAADVSCGVSGRTPAEQSSLIRRFDAYLAKERRGQALGTVTFSARLSDIAADYAHLLDKHGHFDHTGPDGSTPATRMKAAGYCYRFVAENLAMGMFEDAQALFQAWMDSPGHRDNMMHERPVTYGLAANCPPKRVAGKKSPPAGSIASLMNESGKLDRATIDEGTDRNRRPEIFVMLLAKPC